MTFTPVLIIHLALAECAVMAATDSEGRGVFQEAVFCGVCHTNASRSTAMRDAQGREIAPFDLWRSSAMANSSRDPYWRAVVSVEVAATPSRKAEIERTCNRCHAPMAAHAPKSPEGEVLHFLNQQDEQALLGRDGVSCTVCHQIAAGNLGRTTSFTGQFQLHPQPVAFGPHADPFPLSMQQHAGFAPAKGDHILDSALCATCHTLITKTLDPNGIETGHHLYEQSAYLEWRNSVFNAEQEEPGPDARSCQACHVPTTDVDGKPIRTMIARAPGGGDFPDLQPRSPFGRHTFVGGNTLLAQILRDHSAELGVFASQPALDATIAEIRNQLQQRTARVAIGEVQVTDDMLRIPLRVTNLTGHKLPTGFPSRRAWIEIIVIDQDGTTMFASGQFDAAGRIVDAQNRVLDSERAGGPVQPHYRRIVDAQQVQIYESVMSDQQGAVTFTLLRGARYAKDNRLLPRGWRSEHPDAQSTAPAGVGGDDDFGNGQDVIIYEVPNTGFDRCSIQVTLNFQSIGVRHVEEVFTFETPEVAAFKRMYEAANRTPETLATATATMDAQQLAIGN